MPNLLALVSGGKDSLLSIMLAQAHGHRIVGFLNLAPSRDFTTAVPDKAGDVDSYCFQTVGHQIVDAIAECAGVPLFRSSIQPEQSLNTDLVYLEQQKEAATASSSASTSASASVEGKEDEVETLFRLVQNTIATLSQQQQQQQQGSGAPPIVVHGLCSGAILSDYQRLRVERICQRLKLQSYAYLWQFPSSTVLDLVEQLDVTAILIKIASFGYKTRFLGKSLTELAPILQSLERQGMGHAAGEGGEFETVVLDCPLFAEKKLVVALASSRVIGDDKMGTGEGVLVFNVDVVDKSPEEVGRSNAVMSKHFSPSSHSHLVVSPLIDSLISKSRMGYDGEIWRAGYCSVEEAQRQLISCCGVSRAQLVVAEKTDTANSVVDDDAGGSGGALEFHLHCCSSVDGGDISSKTRNILQQLTTADDDNNNKKDRIIYTLVCGSGFQHFGAVNAAYLDYFERTVPPPSRAFVGCGEDFNIRISAVSLSSASSSKNNKGAAFVRRRVLHVQSISSWAAACIGPYAQSNTLECGKCGVVVILTAGTIGLEPSSMVLAGSSSSSSGTAGSSRYPVAQTKNEEEEVAAKNINDCCSSSAMIQLFQESVMCLANVHSILQKSVPRSKKRAAARRGASGGLSSVRYGTVFFATNRLRAETAEERQKPLNIFEKAWEFFASSFASSSSTSARSGDSSSDDDDDAHLCRDIEKNDVTPDISNVKLRVVCVTSLPRDAAVEFVVGAVEQNDVTNDHHDEDEDDARPTPETCACKLMTVGLPKFFAATVPPQA